MANSPLPQNTAVYTPGEQVVQGQPGESAAQEFAPTQADQDSEHPSDWWSESTDGQCSESAALFAASQPAPLSIV